MPNPIRQFILHGERLIDCSLHCPAAILGEGRSHGVYTNSSGINGTKSGEPAMVPLCLAKEAPIQGETKPRTLYERAVRPQHVSRFRGCVYIAERHGITLEET